MLDISDRQNCFYWQTDRNLSVEDYGKYFLRRHETKKQDLVKVLQNGIKSIKGSKDIELIDPDENVVKGNVNIVRKVKINGELFVARIHPQGLINGYFYVEKVALDIAGKNGLPVPKILEVHEAKDEQDMSFVLMTASSGETMTVAVERDKTLESTLFNEAGAALAKVHKIKVEKYGFFDNKIAKTESRLVGIHDTYKQFVWCGLEENLQRLVSFGTIYKAQADKLLGVFKKYDFEPEMGPRLIHNDFADWNFLVNGKSISGIVDWDECHGGDPIADIGCCSLFFDNTRLGIFLKGYKTQTQLPEDFEQRFHYYRLRYAISKVALRVKRAQIDKSEIMQKLIGIGKDALAEELDWFKANG